MRAAPVRLPLALALMLIAGAFAPARAEPIACGPGQRGCGEPLIEEKVRRSFGSAVHVFVGRLESVQDSRHGTAGTRIFTFRIERQFKSALTDDVARVSIHSYLAGGEAPGAGPQRRLEEFEQLESAAELQYTENDRKRYFERVAALRGDIRKNGAADPVPTHVVRLDRSLGDIVLRTTDIPMRIGEQYAVFVFNEHVIAPDPKLDTSNVDFMVLDPVDLYSMNGKRGRRALAALERVSRQGHQ